MTCRKKCQSRPRPYTQVNSKWIIILIVKYKIIELLENAIQEILDDLKLTLTLDKIPREQCLKEISNKLHFITTKTSVNDVSKRII